MPLYEIEYPLPKKLSAVVRAASREEAVAFMRAFGDRVAGPTGLIDLAHEIATDLGVAVEVEELNINGPVAEVGVLSERKEDI